MKYLFLLLISFNSLAGEWSIGGGTAIVKQELRFNNPIQFNMPTAYVEAQYWSDYYVGGRLSVMRSIETPDEFDAEGKKWTNKINAGWQFEIGAKVDLTKKSIVFATAGITEYHTSWWQDGIEPEWSGGTDSHKPSWSVGYKYKFTGRLSAQVMYSYMYEKMKEGYGLEVTQYYSLGVSYSF